MTKIKEFFESIYKDREKITASPDGKLFEENFKTYLKRNGFSEVSKDFMDDGLAKFIKEIKPKILSKINTPICENLLYKTNPDRKDYANFFIWQVNGSQDFPDFLVFGENYIFAIETKFSTGNQKKPMWNSNIPKENSIYVFASHGKKDLTYFLGHDVIEQKEREELLDFWNKTDDEYNKWCKNFNAKIRTKAFLNKYGFSTYVRKAYDQSKTHNDKAILDFFTNAHRAQLEQNVLEFVKKYS